ncbi:MAG TPA: M3 family metallopeptidase [Thermoanaerobaculia bacterium]
MRITVAGLAAIAVVIAVAGCSSSVAVSEPAAGPSAAAEVAAAAENPFFTKLNEPIAYSDVTAQHVTDYAAIVHASTRKRAAEIRSVEQPAFDNVIRAFDEMASELQKASRNSFMLFWVSPDAATREAGLAAYKSLDSLSTTLFSDSKIFVRLVSVASSEVLTGHRKSLADDLLRSMRREGAELDPQNLERFKALREEINELTTRYSTNMNSDIPTLVLDEAGVRGLPESFKTRYAKGEGRYEIPVMPATSAPLMSNAAEEETRKRYYLANSTRAADKNLPILNELMAKRHQLAQLMGHASFADYALEANMAERPAAVWEFLEDLTARTREKAIADLAELKETRRAMDGVSPDAPLSPWDQAYYRNEILKSRYNVDAEKVREYLPLSEALRGMMDLYQELLGYEFRRIENPSVWHDEVEAYEVYESGRLAGRFYLDLFPRPNKESWFYGVPLTPGRLRADGYELPSTMLLGNFTRPSGELPSLVTHAELRTLFHEFGHIMNSIAWKGEFALQSRSLPDFGEAMSQIFENWIWDYQVLSSFAKHYATGEVLPRELFDNMLAARNLSSGLSAQGGLRSAVYDMMLYNRYDPAAPHDTDALWTSIADRFVYAPFVEGTHPQASWIHINTHPVYYYGYIWSRVYAEDMFTQFESSGLWDAATGRRYRQLILANGTQRPIVDVVEEFLGRPMSNEAYIRSLGLGAAD